MSRYSFGSRSARAAWPAVLGLLLAFAACSEPPVAPSINGIQAKRGGPGNGGGSTDPVVKSFAPVDAPQSVTIDLTVDGSGFDEGSQVNLEGAGTGTPAPGITTVSTTFISSQRLVANITISEDAEPALYDVAVTTAGGKRGIGAERFEVLQLLDLGNYSPEGELLMWGAEINNQGHVAGMGASPFFWSEYGGVELLQQGWFATVMGMNESDQIVGYRCGLPIETCSATYNWYGVRWERQGGSWNARQVTGLGGMLMAITDAGEMYGIEPGEFTGQPTVPRRWTAAGSGFTSEPLPLPAGRTSGTVRDANNTGQAVGGDVLWSFEPGGTTQVLILPAPPGTSEPYAVDISDVGPSGDLFTVGWAMVKGQKYPVRWMLTRGVGGAWQVHSTAVLAAPFKRSFGGAARGVSSSGDAVGYVVGTNGYQVAMHWPNGGSPTALAQPHGFNAEAFAINDRGWITGDLSVNQQNHPVVWMLTP